MRRRQVFLLAGLSAALWAGCATGQTGSPVSVSGSGAVLGGQVVSSVGGPVEFWAQYGPTTAYGSETAHETATVEAGVPYRVTGELVISGLARSTTYHYRLCARDSQQSTGAPGCGADVAFTTQSFDCGETVIKSVRLTADLSCGFATPGLVIGAGGIDINLAGHTLGGAFGVGGSGQPAILNSGGHSDVTIRNGDVVGSQTIRLEGASRNTIRDVNANGQTPISLEGGEANEVVASTVFGRGSGIGVVDSDRLLITGTRARGFFAPAISVDGDLARITRNDLPGEDGGFTSAIALRGSDNRVVDNRVGGGWPRGGIALLLGARNLIAENDVSEIQALGSDPPAGDGIFVGTGASGTFLRDNLAQRNGGDGIEVQDTTARLRGNGAFGNGDFGIDAAAGVTDLGGNSAFGNGNPLQCRNVFCL